MSRAKSFDSSGPVIIALIVTVGRLLLFDGQLGQISTGFSWATIPWAVEDVANNKRMSLPLPAFNGSDYVPSTVTELSPMLHRWTNVCLISRFPVKLRTFTGSGPLHSGWLEEAASPHWGPNCCTKFFKSVDLPQRDFLDWKETASFTTEPTLFVFDSSFNIAHCLNDAILAMTTVSMQFTLPNQYIMAGNRWLSDIDWLTLKEDPSPTKQWCYRMMDWAGVVPEKQVKPQNNMACFRELYMPRYVASRFTPTPELAQGLVEIRRRVVERLRKEGLDLSQEPWPSKTTNEWPRVVLYDRRGSPRKHLVDSVAIKEYLQVNFQVHIDLIGPEYESLNQTEQFAFFNNISHIIAPHGAHFSNLVFARPNTAIVEIVCAEKENATATKENPIITDRKMNETAWYNRDGTSLLQLWFAQNSNALGHELFQYWEKEGCRCNLGDWSYPPEQITVNVTHFSEFVASRFGLKRMHMEQDTSGQQIQ